MYSSIGLHILHYISIKCRASQPIGLTHSLAHSSIRLTLPTARNPGVRTIEEDLLEALLKAEAIPEKHRDNLGLVRTLCITFSGF